MITVLALGTIAAVLLSSSESDPLSLDSSCREWLDAGESEQAALLRSQEPDASHQRRAISARCERHEAEDVAAAMTASTSLPAAFEHAFRRATANRFELRWAQPGPCEPAELGAGCDLRLSFVSGSKPASRRGYTARFTGDPTECVLATLTPRGEWKGSPAGGVSPPEALSFQLADPAARKSKSSPCDPIRSGFIGTWEGDVESDYDDGSSSSVEIRLTIDRLVAGAESGTAEATAEDTDCEGLLILEGGSGDTARFSYEETNTEECVDSSRIELTLDADDSMSYTETASTFVSRGTLTLSP